MRPAPDAKDFRRELSGLLPRLRRFALTLTRDAGEADALVQEVCSRAIGQGSSWDGRGRLDGWIYTLTRSVHAEEPRAWRENRAASPAGADAQGQASEVQALILAMPEGYASTFLLVAVEDYSYAEAAAVLDIPPETVAKHVSAARLRLAAMTAASTMRRA
ncbi:RNA polymerase sigma factor [Rhizobium sp. YIM 134829]|uniref:RNA polymerase sigma factor n=1 Tax=Rhizobium sp. YIM 134829 TaxID=3390453 RepID=UPI00397BD17E